MRRVGFEPTISAGERPKTYALDRAANGTGQLCDYFATIVIELPLSMYIPSEIRIKLSKIAMKLSTTYEPPQREGLSPPWLSNQGEG